MDMTEKTVRSEEMFTGRILHVYRDDVELPDGRPASREVVRHTGGVCVLALDREENALVVSQYRYAYGKVLRELPAGKLERGENPARAAVRELKEETGAEAGMVRLFINVGKAQHIKPGDILGAVAGEAKIPGNLVGAIDMFDNYTFVEVPIEYGKDVLKAMKNVKIRGKSINVEPARA